MSEDAENNNLSLKDILQNLIPRWAVGILIGAIGISILSLLVFVMVVLRSGDGIEIGDTFVRIKSPLKIFAKKLEGEISENGRFDINHGLADKDKIISVSHAIFNSKQKHWFGFSNTEKTSNGSWWNDTQVGGQIKEPDEFVAGAKVKVIVLHE